ncbi:MAG: type II toxin-antitoxin system VapC family toxin [Actinomycetota bacterium]|nr:type II toxin-antitoxin system VapC family toxin [Actinomycetota bacterium]
MRLLLDTHAFLWWIGDDPRLSERAREVFSDGNNDLIFSAASGWEIAIKARLGRLRVPGDLSAYLFGQLTENYISVLPVQLSHALRVHALPDHHRDPFDRLLVAQAIVEETPLLSADPWIARYPVEVVW